MTFAAPLFLFAALAAAIPLVLHMVNRQRAPVLPFSTLRFLRISVHRTRRRKYLHDVVLLLLRVAALLLIAVGLARPTLSHWGSLLGRRATSAVAIILDNSASMATLDEGGSRWDLAKKAGERILDQLRDGDAVALLPSCGPPGSVMQKLYSNQDAVRQALENCQVSYERADLRMRLAQARKLLESSEAPNKEIYLITDMQAVSWGLGKEKSPADKSQSSKIPLLLVDVHRPPIPNAALRRVTVESAGPVAGLPVLATAELQGDAAVEQKRHVQVTLDGQQLEMSPTLTIPAGGNVKQSFSLKIDQPGTHRGEVRLLGDDSGPQDNRLFFAVTVDPHIPVAVVCSRNHEIPYLDDAYYLERALVPVSGGRWAIQTTKLTADMLAAEPLSNYAVVFCVNLPALETSVAQRLRDYARRGGHLVWACGPNVDPVRYSAMDEAAGSELLPVRLTTVREPSPDRPEGWRIGWLDTQHPALAPLTEPASLYQSVLIYRHVQTGPAEASGARVLARLDDGEPLLLERTIGVGSVLFWGASVHVDWSNLPLRPVFLPLIARLTFDLAGAEATQPQLVAGAPLRIPIPDASGTTVEIVRPGGETIRPDLAKVVDAGLLYADTHDAGIYSVRLKHDSRQRELAFAANIDPEEVAPAILSADTLKDQLADFTLIVSQGPTDLGATIQKMREGETLFELFLMAVLAALIGEAFVANRRVNKEPPSDAPQPSRGPPRRRLPQQLDEIVAAPK